MQNAVRADLFIQSLALSVARNQVGAALPIGQVLKSEGLTLTEYQDIEANPIYQAYLTRYVGELTESGFSFESKCRVLAEDLLPSFYHMARDPDIPAPVRAKVVENLVKWANLEPKTDVKVGSGTGFSINIVLPGENGGGSTTITAEITPEPAGTAENESEEDLQDSQALDAEYTDVTDVEKPELALGTPLETLETLETHEITTKTPKIEPKSEARSPETLETILNDVFGDSDRETSDQRADFEDFDDE
jgi:hypothetical protein